MVAERSHYLQVTMHCEPETDGDVINIPAVLTSEAELPRQGQ